MSRLASGNQWKPHLKLVEGRWIVKWRAPFAGAGHFPPPVVKIGRINDRPNYLEVFGSSVHFMTKSTERGRLARKWCATRNGIPWDCRCVLPADRGQHGAGDLR